MMQNLLVKKLYQSTWENVTYDLSKIPVSNGVNKNPIKIKVDEFNDEDTLLV